MMVKYKYTLPEVYSLNPGSSLAPLVPRLKNYLGIYLIAQNITQK